MNTTLVMLDDHEVRVGPATNPNHVRLVIDSGTGVDGSVNMTPEQADELGRKLQAYAELVSPQESLVTE